jgi:hypothetical protein
MVNLIRDEKDLFGRNLTDIFYHLNSFGHQFASCMCILRTQKFLLKKYFFLSSHWWIVLSILLPVRSL